MRSEWSEHISESYNSQIEKLKDQLQKAEQLPDGLYKKSLIARLRKSITRMGYNWKQFESGERQKEAEEQRRKEEEKKEKEKQKIDEQKKVIEGEQTQEEKDRAAAEEQRLKEFWQSVTHHQAANAPSTAARNQRYSTRRATSFNPGPFRWYQQSLVIELFEEAASLNTRRRGRAIRVSTDGTVVNNALFRGGDSRSITPYADSIMDRLEHQTEIVDTGAIFRGYALSIEQIDPRGSDHDGRGDGAAGVAQKSSDWVLVDFSPTSTNRDKQMTTSTSLGLNLGFFGNTATGGLSYSYTTGTSWTIRDYDLVSTGGRTRRHTPNVGWQVFRRNDEKAADTDIARSAFTPRFEAVFSLRSEVEPARYSAFSTMATIDYDLVEHQRIMSKTGESLADTLGSLTGLGIPMHYMPKEVEVQKRLIPQIFMQTYVVDWDTGRVYVLGSNDYGGGVDPLLIKPDVATLRQAVVKEVEEAVEELLNSLEERRMPKELVRGDRLPPEQLARELFNPPLPPPAPAQRRTRFQYRDLSPVGVRMIDSGTASVEISVPEERMIHYPDGFEVHCSHLRDEWSYEWLPGKRAVFVEHHAPDAPYQVWISPKDYDAGTCTVHDTETGSTDLVSVLDLGLPEIPDAVLPQTPGGVEAAGAMADPQLLAWRGGYRLIDAAHLGASVLPESHVCPMPPGLEGLSFGTTLTANEDEFFVLLGNRNHRSFALATVRITPDQPQLADFEVSEPSLARAYAEMETLLAGPLRSVGRLGELEGIEDHLVFFSDESLVAIPATEWEGVLREEDTGQIGNPSPTPYADFPVELRYPVVAYASSGTRHYFFHSPFAEE
ncbi:hypothetical protein [Nocardiopsis sp. FIRDI 009]|uniref:hypothetical protein n=1 Tax=Nocardiopsis sp. FIRDI 009 TaxID=714197 RepID=UPI000E23F8D2|nr:hypothetical protein [Nocardiopsis sp. FIRDI 009]